MLDRRTLLKALLLTSGVTLIPFGREAWAAQVGGDNPNRLVVIFMRGAVDGLSLVVPYKEQAYYESRPTIAIKPPGSPDGVINLDGYFGLHPALSGLMPLWQAKQLAFVQAAGSPDPSRSHFDAQAYMESGTPGKVAGDGWMNRVLANLPGPHGPTQGISFGPTLPLIMKGNVPVETTDFGDAGKPGPIDRPMVAQAFNQMYAGADSVSRSYQEGRQAHAELLTDFDDEQKAANNGAPLPNGFSRNAAQLAKLMSKDASVQLAFLALGGWDTHVGQGAAKGKLANILQPLGDGLGVLAQNLGPVWKNTIVLVVSEFGRTVKENGGQGTDHGHGNVMWVLGGGVNGGKVYGDWPGLGGSQLYQGRDLAVTTDFRSPIELVLSKHMRLPDKAMAEIFPKAPPASAHLSGLISA